MRPAFAPLRPRPATATRAAACSPRCVAPVACAGGRVSGADALVCSPLSNGAAAAELAAPVVPSALAKPRAASADLTPSPDAPPPRGPAAVAAATEAPAGEAPPEALVGRRLRVWWPEERAFFEGAVVSYDAASGAHVVSYDDGDEERVRLSDERVEWLPDAPKRCAQRRDAHAALLCTCERAQPVPFALLACLYAFIRAAEVLYVFVPELTASPASAALAAPRAGGAPSWTATRRTRRLRPPRRRRPAPPKPRAPPRRRRRRSARRAPAAASSAAPATTTAATRA